MNNNRKRPLIILTLTALVYVSYLIFVGYALHDFRWNLGLSIFFAFLLGIVVFLLIGVFAFILLINNQKNKTLSGKSIAITYLCIAFIPFSALVVYRVNDNQAYKTYYTFTSARWAAADGNERGRLIDSFREIYEVVGLEKDEVIALLGEPNTEVELNGAIYYQIGDYGQFLAFDPFSYVIEYDINLVVTSEYIIQH